MKVDRRRWTGKDRQEKRRMDRRRQRGEDGDGHEGSTVFRRWTRNGEKVRGRKGKRRFAFLDFCELLRLVRWGGLDFSQSY
jgi:hypothetical protein